jgi:hypothetical protein
MILLISEARKHYRSFLKSFSHIKAHFQISIYLAENSSLRDLVIVS